MRYASLFISLGACGFNAPPAAEAEVEVEPAAVNTPVIPQADDVRVAFFDAHYQDDTWFAVPVACVTQEGTVLGNEACAAKLTGQVATLPAGRTVLGGMTTVTCEPTGDRAMALVAPIDDEHSSQATWGYLGVGVPSGWHLASRSRADDALMAPALATLVDSRWPLSPDATDVQLDERMDLNGTRVLEAFAPSMADDKPGYSALFVAGSDILPLPTTGLSLNGRIRTPGAFPVPNNGYILVLTSKWMGGSGVHAVHLAEAGPVTIGEWACGT
jgi:hypothetical protein